MSTITEYLSEAELALAAYAVLTPNISGLDYIEALKQDGNGMSQKQAEEFAKHWRVVEQYDGKVEETYIDEFGQEHFFLNPTGLSVTLFEEVGTGKQVVAVRGTQPTDILDLTTDLIDLIVLGTDEHQAQYKALTGQVRKWMDDGVLQSGFSVTGHSLGGFLATNLALDYAGDVSHTYIYNAPGVEGVVRGNVIGAVWNAYSPDSPFAIPAVLSISNVVAKTDVASDIGLYITPPIKK